MRFHSPTHPAHFTGPRSEITKVYLRFARGDEEIFDLDVDSNITIEQLKREIAFEEKIDVHVVNLKARLDDEGGLETLDDELAILNLSLESQVIEISSKS